MLHLASYDVWLILLGLCHQVRVELNALGAKGELAEVCWLRSDGNRRSAVL